jgi:SAM-dependent methyltransferase
MEDPPMDAYLAATRTSYDRVAAAYTAQIAGELAHKPLDRALLACFAEQVRGQGPVADIGCGPGHVAAYLAELGLPVHGLDLAPGMLARARQRYPALPCVAADMLALPVADGTWAGLVAFYSIIHLPPADLPRGLREFYRVLQPGGRALISFHIGAERVHLDEFMDSPVALDFQFYEPAPVAEALTAAGFEMEAQIVREPYVGFEHPSRRAYLLARKPAAR